MAYSYVTSIFTLAAPHKEVQGRQTKLHPGFTLGKLVLPSPGRVRNSGCPVVQDNQKSSRTTKYESLEHFG